MQPHCEEVDVEGKEAGNQVVVPKEGGPQRMAGVENQGEENLVGV